MHTFCIPLQDLSWYWVYWKQRFLDTGYFIQVKEDAADVSQVTWAYVTLLVLAFWHLNLALVRDTLLVSHRRD
jgi:hypothetical protein